MSLTRLLSIVAVSALWAVPSAAEIHLPSLFADQMVLQQGLPIPIWGWANPDEEVKIQFAGQLVSTRANEVGKWSAELKPLAASSEGRSMMIAGNNAIEIKEVLVGEVWICSGQSNMQWQVRQSANADQEIAAANLPQVRMFSVDRLTSTSPADQCKGAWKTATTENVGDFSAVGYFFGRHLHQVLKTPVGLINSSWGGTRIEAWTSIDALRERPSARDLLDDWESSTNNWDEAAQTQAHELRKEAWRKQVAAVKQANAANSTNKPLPPAPQPPLNPSTSQHRPAALFNAMIAPLIPFPAKGAIWYQGESNQKRAFQYQELLPTLINDWRNRWNLPLSFYIVQLANFGNNHPVTTAPGVADTWAELQEAQLLTAITLPNCGLAVINDIGEEKDIHPKNKQEVGRRLALWALAKDYGKTNTVYSGPLYRDSKIEGDKVRISFNHADNGLKTRDGAELKHFQIAGADEAWHWAKAEIDGSEVTVSSPAVPQPVGVRYAWSSWPEGANLVNAEGLPASCFRTDPFLPMTLGVTSPFKEATPTTRP